MKMRCMQKRHYNHRHAAAIIKIFPKMRSLHQFIRTPILVAICSYNRFLCPMKILLPLAGTRKQEPVSILIRQQRLINAPAQAIKIFRIQRLQNLPTRKVVFVIHEKFISIKRQHELGAMLGNGLPRQTVHDFAVCEFHAIKPMKRQRQSLGTQLLQNIPCRIRTLMVGNNQLIRIRQAVTHKTLNLNYSTRFISS